MKKGTKAVVNFGKHLKENKASFSIQEEVEEGQGNPDLPLTVINSQEVSLVQALHTTTVFAGPQRRRGGEESSTPRNLSWLTGNNPMFAANGKTPLPGARGFFIDKPNEDEMFPADYELMDAMEILCEQGKAREVVVEHYDKDTNKPNRVPSWELHEISLFVVCEGIPSKSEMERDNSDRWGVAYAWPAGSDKRSKLRFNCFIKELMDTGYNGLFMASFSSFCTSRAIATLKAHEHVLKFVDKLRAKAGETEPVPYYAYALPIKCSTKTLTASNGEKSKEVYYPVPAIPHLSVRNLEASLAYLASMAITEEQAYILEYNGRVEQAVRWSIEETSRIITGRDNEQAPEEPKEKSSVDDDRPF
jgi:hypothetical protein